MNRGASLGVYELDRRWSLQLQHGQRDGANVLLSTVVCFDGVDRKVQRGSATLRVMRRSVTGTPVDEDVAHVGVGLLVYGEEAREGEVASGGGICGRRHGRAERGGR
jgi:hypothetical protein